MNLYGKIFLGFWFATLAILGSWMVAARYFEYLPTEQFQEQLRRFSGERDPDDRPEYSPFPSAPKRELLDIQERGLTV